MTARLTRGGGDPAPSEAGENNRGNISLIQVPVGDPLVIPSVDPRLISYLNHMFPDRLSLVEKLGSVEAATGARTVVEHLIQLSKEQDTTNHVHGRIISTPGADGPGTPAAAPGGSPG